MCVDVRMVCRFLESLAALPSVFSLGVNHRVTTTLSIGLTWRVCVYCALFCLLCGRGTVLVTSRHLRQP
jgi:hypothetical protein